jgi:hypothetical protein
MVEIKKTNHIDLVPLLFMLGTSFINSSHLQSFVEGDLKKKKL